MTLPAHFRRGVAAPWYWLSNFSSRVYLSLMGHHGDDARLLIFTLAFMRRWALTRRLDFRAAVVASERLEDVDAP